MPYFLHFAGEDDSEPTGVVKRGNVLRLDPIRGLVLRR